MKRILAFLLIVLTLVLTGCSSDSDTVNKNIDKEADTFRVLRRVVVYNGITDKILLSVEGYCSLNYQDANRIQITCKSGTDYFRDGIGKSDNTFVYYEQLENSSVSAKHYKVLFRPETIIPQPEIR